MVVSALHLSDMTGVELASALRADPACGGVGFVLATSEADADAAAAVAHWPRAVLIPKPFDLRHLADAIAAAAG